MNEKSSACEGCVLRWTGTGFLPSVGPSRPALTFVGDFPSHSEVRSGVPLTEGGAIFNRLLSMLGRRREEFALHSVLSCVPPASPKTGRPWLSGAPYEASSVNQCRTHLDRTLGQAGPVVVALGETAMRALLDIPRLPKATMTEFHGHVIREPHGRFWVVPTFDPRFLQRGGQNLMGVVLRDLQRALDVARSGHEPSEPDIVEDPSVEWLAAWAASYLEAVAADPSGIWLAVDIETPHGIKGNDLPTWTIERINFAAHPDEGVTVPWTGAYVEIARRLLASPGIKVFWNWRFDVRRLEHNASPINGRIWDAMDCLRGDTRIPLVSGGWMFLADIVDQQLDAEVWTRNSTGEKVPTRIVQYHKRLDPGVEWMKVNTSGSRFPINCTPEHQIMTPTGWKCADTLQGGDLIYGNNPGADDLIHGSLLGDGHLPATGGDFSVTHTIKQEAYCRAKAKAFGATVKQYAITTGYSTGGIAVIFHALIDKRWRAIFYPQGKKIFISPPTDRALAIWYMDDGSWTSNGADYYRAKLTVCEYDLEAVITWARETFGADVTMHQEVLYFHKAAKDVLFGKIASYVHPSMDWKLPEEFRGRYNGWLDTPECGTSQITSIANGGHNLSEWPGRKFDRRQILDTRYCLTVENPTHSFFTAGGLVHNCWHAYQSDMGGSDDDKGGAGGAATIKGNSLGFVAPFYSTAAPWKHLSDSRPSYYAGKDGAQTLRIIMGVVADLKRDGMLHVPQIHLSLFDQFVMSPAEKVGLGVDLARLPVFTEDLKRKETVLLAEIEALAPPEVGGLHPGPGWASPPESAVENAVSSSGRVATTMVKGIVRTAPLVNRPLVAKVKKCMTCGLASRVTAKHRCKERFVNKKGIEKERVSKTLVPDVRESEELTDRWYIRLPFNPGSSQQMKRVFAVWSLPLSKGDKADKLALESALKKSAKNEPRRLFFKCTLAWRKIKKIEGTYGTGTLKRIAAQEARGVMDGRLHASYTNRPSTLRVSVRSPNLNNVVSR